jgi:hypothetical protein
MFHLEINAVARRSFDEEILQSVLSVCRGETLFAHPAMYQSARKALLQMHANKFVA